MVSYIASAISEKLSLNSLINNDFPLTKRIVHRNWEGRRDCFESFCAMFRVKDELLNLIWDKFMKEKNNGQAH